MHKAIYASIRGSCRLRETFTCLFLFSSLGKVDGDDVDDNNIFIDIAITRYTELDFVKILYLSCLELT